MQPTVEGTKAAERPAADPKAIRAAQAAVAQYLISVSAR